MRELEREEELTRKAGSIKWNSPSGAIEEGAVVKSEWMKTRRRRTLQTRARALRKGERDGARRGRR